jgi:hypothetical protein
MTQNNTFTILSSATDYNNFVELIKKNNMYIIDIQNVLYYIFLSSNNAYDYKNIINFINKYLIENHFSSSQFHDIYLDILDEICYTENTGCHGECYLEHLNCSLCSNKNLKVINNILKNINSV